MFEPQITLEELMSKVSSFDIFKHYCTNFRQIGKLFCSEFRSDKSPSCSIKMYNGDLLYKDFGGDDSYDAIGYVMRKYNLDFNDTLNKIYEEIISGDGSNNGNTLDCRHIDRYSNKDASNSIIRIKKRDFTNKDIEYWSRFYWTEDMLKMSKTYSISHYWINDVFFNVEDELGFSYDYYEHNGVFRRKLYFPERSNYKWFSNVDNSIVQLVDVAPKMGDVLFITSSKKDAGVFWRMQLDNMFSGKVIHGVAPNSENVCVPELWLKKIKQRWKHVILYYDYDDSGIKNSIKFSKQFEIEHLNTGIKNLKDPSDFCKELGILEFKEKLIKDLKHLNIQV